MHKTCRLVAQMFVVHVLVAALKFGVKDVGWPPAIVNIKLKSARGLFRPVSLRIHKQK